MTPVDPTPVDPASYDRLHEAAARRLHDLLTRRLGGAEWERLETEALSAMKTPRLRFALLLFFAAGRASHRVRRLTWEAFRAVLSGEETPERRRDAAHIGRAMRLLKRLLRAGCEKRGEA